MAPAPTRSSSTTRAVAVAGALAAGLAAAAVFGAVLGGVGEWVEGRRVATVAPWAVPGLAAGLLASGAAARALATRHGHRAALALGALAAVALVAVVLLNPSISPPVP